MQGLGVQGLGFDPPRKSRKVNRPTPADPDEPRPYNWNTGRSERSRHYPPDWEKRRQAVKARAGGKCQIREPDICAVIGTDCDHINNERDEHGNYNDELSNLRWACKPCHNRHTSQQGNAAKKQINRPPEQHPGLIGFEPPQYPKYDNRNTTSGKDDQNDQ